MILSVKLFDHVYNFSSLKEVMAKANERKSGDTLAGIAASSSKERVAAKVVLSKITLKDLKENPAVPYEEDEVTRIIIDDLNLQVYDEIKDWTVSDLREWLLSYEATPEKINWIRRGLTSEMIAAVTKLMSNMDLIVAANKIEVYAHCNTTIGGKETLAVRLQPNHTTDDPDGIMISTLEGLTYDYDIPTQTCVLAHVTTQMEAIKRGAKVDLIFQSIAGSEKGNEAFGINGTMIEEARKLALKQGTAAGPNVMYFETGQGSELSSDAHNGADQVTMEARCYGFAKRFQPFLVNTVVGFIGPEYLYDSKQVIRAGLEDHFMGKLHGLPMGVDVCYTNHMKADQSDVEVLATLLTTAGCNYFMGIPAGDDIMLNYQTTGFHDNQSLRELFGKHPIKEFKEWLVKYGFMTEDGKLTEKAGDPSVFLK